jgi:Fic family protein
MSNEWLLDKQLNIPDSGRANTVDVLDASLQYPGPARLSKRHFVRNNLPGFLTFCPIIRKTEKLEQFILMNLRERSRMVLGDVHPDVLLRAAAFMLLKDSKASFAIEGETPLQTRAERWGQAISQAGIHPLSYEELIRLQEIIISDFRFTHYGYRNEGGFVGEHDRATGLPIPDHISARCIDLYVLMDGLIATNELLKNSAMDPILAATIIGFGFVFIHPFEDGNGRIHRYLIHHVLAEMKFASQDIVFPISSVILEKLSDYRKVLESFSRPRLALTEWRPTEKGNVEVLNETIDLFRYFDATKQAEFLYQCIQETIEETLPEEVSYLKKYDEMKLFINQFLDMPNRLVDLLIQFLHQEQGILSKRARRKEFNALTEHEISILEEKYADIFLKENK